MAIVLKSKKYNEIKIDTKIINGVLGNNYEVFLESLEGKSVCYINNVNLHSCILENDEYAKLLNLNKIIGKDVKELSHSERKLLSFYVGIKKNSKIIIVNEPYLDLDFNDKKNINNLFNILIKEGKTVIIGSQNSNIIYSLCKKVILVDNYDLLYNDVMVLRKKDIINKYRISMPNIIRFVELAKKKNIRIPYSKDIRDLIKDVYRNVS